MGIQIKSVWVSSPSFKSGSIAHAVFAAKRCLEAASVSAQEIDLLLNVGIFRDHNMVEPAMAALIQKELEMNLDLVRFPTKKPTASFDLMNGPCGALNAVQVAQAFLFSEATQNVLVVASDAHPSNREVESFSTTSSGSAWLLQRSSEKSLGFGRVQVRSSQEGSLGREAFTSLFHRDSREQVTERQDADYLLRLTTFITDSIQSYVAEEKLALDRTLILLSQPTPEFGSQVAQRLGVDSEAIVRVPGVRLDLGSSALAFAYDQVVNSGASRDFDQLLFVAAGAGLTSACAVYRS
jgi:3-oxoacyl-[acyl-carrier-protein] synthase-3